MRKIYLAKVFILVMLLSATFDLPAQSNRQNLSNDEKALLSVPGYKPKKAITSKSFLNTNVALRNQSSVCDTAMTIFASGNGLDGILFDISAVQDLTITGLSANLLGNGNYVLYYRTGTFVGHETSATGWINLGTASIVANPVDSPSVIPIPINLPLVAGDVIGIYLADDNTASTGGLKYTDASSGTIGGIYSNNGDLQVRLGSGSAYPFSFNFGPRIPNVIFDYCFPVTGLNEIATAKISVSPNLFHTSTTLYINNQISTRLEIFNVVGSLVKRTDNITSSTYTIDREGLNNGVYFYRVSQNDKVINSGKLIIQ